MTNARKIVALVAGCASLLLAIPAQAQDIVVTANLPLPHGTEAVSKTVPIKDLNLKTVAGVNAMERRVSAVIAAMCDAPPRAAQWQMKDAKACQDHAWAGARPQMDGAMARANGN